MSRPLTSNSAYGGRRRRPARRGVTIVVVLGLISITLALSYAMMRSQGAAIQIQKNNSRLSNARRAAQSGLTAALGKMHHSSWTGIDTTMIGRLSPTESFEVRFEPGDSRLNANHPEYADYPFRVTLVSTGYCTGDQATSGVSMYRLQAVAQLTPTSLAATPTDWQAMQQYSVYQWDTDPFAIDLPSRIEGPVWMQGPLSLAPHYPSHAAAASRYLSDLNVMRLAGRGDYRPFNDTIYWHNQSTAIASRVQQELGIPTVTSASHRASDWHPPTALESYQVYPGGPRYTIPRLGAVLENVTLAADPKTNPLGIVLREGTVELKNNVSITGMLISTEDVFVAGKNVQLKAVDLPSLAQSSDAVRLQTLWTGDDFRVLSTGGGSLEGVASVRDEFEVQAGPETTEFNLVGRLITKGFYIRGRNEWSYTSGVWEYLHDVFRLYVLREPVPIVSHFPEFMSLIGRKPQPKITIKPETQPRRWHWTNLSEPIYKPADSDAGLRWDLIDWSDSPAN